MKMHLQTLSAKLDSDFYKKNSIIPEIGKKNITYNPVTCTNETEKLLKQAINNTKGALTTSYGSDIVEQLKKISQKSRLTSLQYEVLNSIGNKLIEIENWSPTPFNLQIDESTDNEIVISRKSINGVSIMSVNEYGDIMVHYVGFKEGKKLNFYDHEAFDSENVVYDFLHP